MKPSLKDIERTVAAKYGLTWEDMRGPRRARKIARPRQIAMYLCRQLTGASMPRIGTHFCRDHTTVLHALRQIPVLMAENPKVTAHVMECREAVLAKVAEREPVERSFVERFCNGEVIVEAAE